MTILNRFLGPSTGSGQASLEMTGDDALGRTGEGRSKIKAAKCGKPREIGIYRQGQDKLGRRKKHLLVEAFSPCRFADEGVSYS